MSATAVAVRALQGMIALDHGESVGSVVAPWAEEIRALGDSVRQTDPTLARQCDRATRQAEALRAVLAHIASR